MKLRDWWRERVWYRLRGRLLSTRTPRRVGLTPSEADKLFPSTSQCAHCGGWHPHACPRIHTILFRVGNPVRVEFWPWGAWPADQVVFPWQKAKMVTLPDAEEEAIEAVVVPVVEGEIVG